MPKTRLSKSSLCPKIMQRLELFAYLVMSTSVLKALPDNLISKYTNLVFSISLQASRRQQAFSKPCLVNLISKDTCLVFSISQPSSPCQQEFSKPRLVNLISKDTFLVFSISRKPNDVTKHSQSK